MLSFELIFGYVIYFSRKQTPIPDRAGFKEVVKLTYMR